MNGKDQPLPPPDPPDLVGTVDDDGAEEGSFFAETADPSAEGEAGEGSYFAQAVDPSTEDDEDDAKGGSYFADVVDPATPGAREADRVEGLGGMLDPQPPHRQAQHGGPEHFGGERSAPSEGVETTRLDDDRLRELAKEIEQARRMTPQTPEGEAERIELERTENKLKSEMAARGMLTDEELQMEHMLVEDRLNRGEGRAGDAEYDIRLKWEMLTRFDYGELLSLWQATGDALAKGDHPRRAVEERWHELIDRQLVLRERAASPEDSYRAPWRQAEYEDPGEPRPVDTTLMYARFFSAFFDVLPYTGAAKAFNEAYWGKDMFTGEELSGMERVLGAALGGYEVLGPTFSGPSREPSRPSAPDVPAGPLAGGAQPAATPAADADLVWVNRSSHKYHAMDSHQGRHVEQDADRGVHWEKMSREQAGNLGFQAARGGDPIREKALGRERVADFLSDYVEGGRERMFDAPANPMAIHQEVPLYSKVTVDGKDYYVQSDPRRTLDIVDLTDAENPKTFEIGTQTPSRQEVERKDGQTAAWEAAREEALELRRQGGDGKVYGKLANGTFVDLTTAEYFIPPDVRNLVEPPPGPGKP